MDPKILVKHSRIEINNYELGDCPKLEYIFSVWDPVTHQSYPKGIEYDEGYYESLLITLGEGKGDNWWCVLFPPLCLIEAEESTEVEYKSFIKEIIEHRIHLLMGVKYL